METNNKQKKRRSTFAALFYINRTKIRKDGMCRLLCKISIDAQSEQIGTKVSVNPSLWDPSAGRATGRSRNALEVNRTIDLLTGKIILKTGILREETVCRKIRNKDGGILTLYNMEMITALAFRLKSCEAEQFRRWIVGQAIIPAMLWKIPGMEILLN